jgi:hypothetical protein
MVLSTTFNKISVILWWSVLLVEETEVPGENHPPATSHCIRNKYFKSYQCYSSFSAIFLATRCNEEGMPGQLTMANS